MTSLEAVPLGEAAALMPDCGGAVRGLAMAVPGTYLAPGHEAVRHAIASLVLAFDAGLRLTLLARAEDQNACADWLAGLRPRCATSVVAVPPDATLKTLWIQDRFLCCTSDRRRRIYLFPPSSAAENMGAWLAAADGSAAEEMRTGLSGGNCLVGEDYWLAGAASVEQSVAFLPPDQKNRESARRAIAAIDRRRLVVVGHSYDDLKNRHADPCRGETAQAIAAASDRDLRQPVFHLDVFLTPTGETSVGKPLLLVGEPIPLGNRRGADLSYRAPIAAVCRRLAAAGFAVLRNPVAVLPAKREAGGPRFWRPYNNVLLQNRPEKIVWLPQFADDEWPELRQLDEENRAIWRGLGFAVRPIDGWGAVAALGGGVRCIAKVTARDDG